MDILDILDKDENPLHKTATYDEVRQNGLWTRGVHVILYTPSKKIVMQKRSDRLDYHPGEIEVSVGGSVKAGETPEQAIIRETKEETGIVLSAGDLKFVGKMKFNHSYKKHGRKYYMKAFIYSYSAQIPEDTEFKPQDDEAQLLFLLPLRHVKRSVRKHYVLHFGRLTSMYSYWLYLLRSIE
jgi:8-oxo-dGTP pyrophosphatase MutT (NUDIX family)